MKLVACSLTCALALSATADFVVYENLSTPSNGAYAAGGAAYVADSNLNMTRMIADDLTLDPSAIGTPLANITVQSVNLGGPASYITFVDVWYDNAGTIGSYIGGSPNGTGIGNILTSNKIWVGVTFFANPAVTSVSQLNNIGLSIHENPSLGSSADTFAVANSAGWASMSSPAVTYGNFGGSPLANFGIRVVVVPEPTGLAVLSTLLALCFILRRPHFTGLMLVSANRAKRRQRAEVKLL